MSDETCQFTPDNANRVRGHGAQGTRSAQGGEALRLRPVGLHNLPEHPANELPLPREAQAELTRCIWGARKNADEVVLAWICHPLFRSIGACMGEHRTAARSTVEVGISVEVTTTRTIRTGYCCVAKDRKVLNHLALAEGIANNDGSFSRQDVLTFRE
jgi:hypothetical protein